MTYAPSKILSLSLMNETLEKRTYRFGSIKNKLKDEHLPLRIKMQMSIISLKIMFFIDKNTKRIPYCRNFLK